MKNLRKLAALTWSLVLVFHTALATAAETRCEICIVYDASWAAKSSSTELRAVAEAIARASRPGDRVRLIVAYQSGPRLLLLHDVSDGKSVAREVRQALAGVVSPLFSSADLTAALKVPLSALNEATHKRPALVVVVTDCRLSKTRSSKLLVTAKEIRAAGGHVVVTGASASARGILAAAAEDRIEWSCLSKADPAKWLREVREPEAKEQTNTEASEEANEKAEEEAAEGAEGGGLSDARRRSTRIQLRVDEYDRLPMAPEGSTKPKRAEPVPVPEPMEPEVAEHQPVLPMPKVEAPASSPKPGSSVPPQPSSGLQPGEAPPKAPPPSIVALTFRELWRSKWRTLGLIAAASALAVAFPVARSYGRAARGRGARPSSALPGSKRAHELAAVINGRELPLGIASQLKRIGVGRDASNPVVLDTEGVDRKHFQLLRRGRRWFVRNLSKKILEADHAPVPAGKTQPISFPAQVKIHDGACVSFKLRPKAS